MLILLSTPLLGVGKKLPIDWSSIVYATVYSRPQSNSGRPTVKGSINVRETIRNLFSHGKVNTLPSYRFSTIPYQPKAGFFMPTIKYSSTEKSDWITSQEYSSRFFYSLVEGGKV